MATEGADQADPNMLHDQNRMLAELLGINPTTVAVLKDGNPVLMPWINAAPAAIEVWNQGTEDGHVVADLLFGVVSPSRKVPTWREPRGLDQTRERDLVSLTTTARSPRPMRYETLCQSIARANALSQEARQMFAGEGLNDAGRQDIDRAIQDAEAVSGFRFSVFIGASEGDTRGFANQLHSALAAPDESVLIMVDPSARIVEVVTGQDARRALTDDEAGLAVLAMQSDFAFVGLASGIIRGLHQLAEQARRPPLLHDQP